MSTPADIVVFLASLALTLAAAGFFADRLDHIGPRLGLPEPIVGLLTAAAADAPEIASAVVALIRGQRDVGLGVVLGSNAFNLAAMIGVSALLTGAVAVERGPLLLEGSFGAAATLVVFGLSLGVLDPATALGLVAALGAGYLVTVVRSHARPHARSGTTSRGQVWRPALLIVPAISLIAVGALGMVHSALTLASRWHVSPALVGVSVLAVLTSVPNAFTAVRLGLAGRGNALVSETFGSNSINLLGGVIVPALAVGFATHSTLGELDLAWVLGMTLVATGMLARQGGLRRGGAVILICLYLIFMAAQLVRL
jgi:cation:H+ antiporter